jgi:hypothetical protein
LVSFRQSWPDDLDILARVIATGNLDFTELIQEIDRDDGYDFLTVEEYTRNFSQQDTWSGSISVSKTHTITSQTTHASGFHESNSFGSSLSTADGRARTRSPDGRELSTADHATSSRAANKSHATGTSNSTADASGQADGQGSTLGQTEGGSKGTGLSIARRLLPLSRKRTEIQRTGQLERSIADQFERIRQMFHGLGVSQAIAKVREQHKAFAFETVNVDEKWLPRDKFQIIEQTKQEITSQHAYFSPARLQRSDEERRLLDYLADASATEALPQGKSTPRIESSRAEDTIPTEFSPPNHDAAKERTNPFY